MKAHFLQIDYMYGYLRAHHRVHVCVHVVVVVVIVVVIVVVVIVVVVDCGYDVDDGVEECHSKGQESQLGVSVTFLQVVPSNSLPSVWLT